MQLFDPSSILSSANHRLGKMLTGSALFRGATVSEACVEKSLAAYAEKNTGSFAEWIPNRLMSSTCSRTPAIKAPMCASYLTNHTAINTSLGKLME